MSKKYQMWILLSLFLFFGLVIVFLIPYFLRNAPFESFKNDRQNMTTLFQKYLDRPADPVFLGLYRQKTWKEIEADLSHYSRQVQRGRDYVQNKKIVIAGLIRDSAHQLEFLRSFFEEIRSCCQDCVLLLVENDSRDETRKHLQEWAEKDASVILLCPGEIYPDGICRTTEQLQKTFSKSPLRERIEKMAILRNTYLKHVQEHFSDFDYLLVKDTDLRGDFFFDGLFHSLCMMREKSFIEAIACNGLIRSGKQYIYYDSFAYARLDEDSEWSTLFDKRSHDEDVTKYVTERYLEGQNHLRMDRVRSAFGGICLYRISSLRGKKYGYSRNRLTCEHTVLHKQLRHVYVNPRMIFLIEENVH